MTRPALIVRLGFVFNPSEIDTLLRPSPSPSWQWAGQWDKTPWRRPSPLARVLAGVGPVLLSGDLASALAGIGFENLNPSPPSRDLTDAICQNRAGAAAASRGNIPPADLLPGCYPVQGTPQGRD